MYRVIVTMEDKNGYSLTHDLMFDDIFDANIELAKIYDGHLNDMNNKGMKVKTNKYKSGKHFSIGVGSDFRVFGVISVEHKLPVLYTYGVIKDKLTINVHTVTDKEMVGVDLPLGKKYKEIAADVRLANNPEFDIIDDDDEEYTIQVSDNRYKKLSYYTVIIRNHVSEHY